MSLPQERDLSANMEDYLETIYHLQRKHRVARVKDIAEALGVSRSSVSAALKSLNERGLIDYEPYSFVTLKKGGQAIAQEIVRRHETLREFFADVLKLEAGQAEANACRMEHAIDPEAIDRLILFLEFLRGCPRSGQDWLEAFNLFCRNGIDQTRCRSCIKQVSAKLLN